MRFSVFLAAAATFGMSLSSAGAAETVDVNATVSALRMSGAITGGLLPASSPEFKQMVSQIQGGDYHAAAMTAINTPYFSKYLARRMALEMMTPALDPTLGKDNDASVFLIANMIGSGGLSPNISRWWSANTTCLVKVTAKDGTSTINHAFTLNSTQLAEIDYTKDIVCSAGQQAADSNNTDGDRNTIDRVTIPEENVGGYLTLSYIGKTRQDDGSFASYGTTAGTNLRFIVGAFEIATGLDLMDMASSADASALMVPKFVPQSDPNFFHGQGQPACIACHGGGLVSIHHGYGTVADLFDYTNNGFTYFSTLTTRNRKSLGSNPNDRAKALTCDYTKFTVCNPDSAGVDASRSWDVSANWSASGLLTRMGWKGPVKGQGLNSLGKAIGQASIVYSNLVKRVIRDVCPLGGISEEKINSIATNAQSADDFRGIVAEVMSQPSCH